MELINDLRQELKDYRDEIAFKNEQIRHHNEAMDRKDATLKELYNKLLEK
jgi:flagellar hook-associated protein FlgK